MFMLCLKRISCHRSRHERVAITIATDPRPETERRATNRRGDPQASDLSGVVIEHLGNCTAEQFVEVVDDRRCLVPRVRPVPSELVGLPHEVDGLSEPSVDAALISLRGPDVESAFHQGGNVVQLREDGSTRRLGRVSSEHRAHLETFEELLDLARFEARLFDLVDSAFHPTALARGSRRELVEAMRLLRDVRQIEIRSECPPQGGQHIDIESIEQPIEFS